METSIPGNISQQDEDFRRNLKLVSVKKIVWEFSKTTLLDCFYCEKPGEYLVVFTRNNRYYEMVCCKHCVDKKSGL